MALGDVPSAVQTLVALADRIRTKGDPAAELILLPEGGEVRDEHKEPVLKAFGHIKRRRALIDAAQLRLRESANGSKSRTQLEQQITRTRKAAAEELASLPIRPALIDDVVTELRHVDEEFHTLEHLSRDERGRSLQRAGDPRRRNASRFPPALCARAGSRGHCSRRKTALDGGQPPSGRLDRQAIHEPRPLVPRPDSGRQPRTDEGGGIDSSSVADSSSRPTPHGGLRQSISRSIADHGRTIRLPVHVIESLNRLEKERKALRSEHGRIRRRTTSPTA
jgi:hypothetical protein